MSAIGPGSGPGSGESPPLRGPVPWIVAWRFLRNRRSRLLDGTARAALAATALGVTALVVAMALMTGYQEDLQAKLLSGNAAVLAYPLGHGGEPVSLTPETEARLAALPAVEAVTRVAYGQGALSRPGPGGGAGRSVDVTLRGVDPTASERAIPGGDGGPEVSGLLAASLDQLATDADGVPGAILGAELARSLDAEPGDILRLVVLGFSRGDPRFRYATVRLAGTFSSGFAEFDSAWMILDRRLVQRLGGSGGASDLVEIVADPAATAEVVAATEALLDDTWVVTDARDLNRPLFAALELQKTLLFLVLGLIVCVSTFNTASTLVVLVRERMRDIGILSTLGLSPGGLRATFLVYGTLLGAVGTLVGVVLGTAACWVITEYELIRFDPEVARIYFLSSVPFRVQAADVLAVVAFTQVVTILSCLLPAYLAARVDAARALRYE